MRSFSAVQVSRRAGVYAMRADGTLTRIVTSVVATSPHRSVSLVVNHLGQTSLFMPHEWNTVKFIEAEPISLHFGPKGSRY